MSLEFNTAKKRKEPIHFVLDGEEYEYTPQKQADQFLSAVDGDELGTVRASFDWLSNGLPDDQSQRLVDRLKDPDDDLDIDDLGDILDKLRDQVAGRPTTSRGGSSASQTSNGQSSTGGRRRKASTS